MNNVIGPEWVYNDYLWKLWQRYLYKISYNIEYLSEDYIHALQFGWDFINTGNFESLDIIEDILLEYMYKPEINETLNILVKHYNYGN